MKNLPQVNRAAALCLCLCLAATLTACGGRGIQPAYQGLEASAITYDMVMTAAGKAYAQGAIDEDRRAEIIKIGREYQRIWEASQAALLRWTEAVNADDAAGAQTEYATYQNTAAEASVALAALLDVAKPYLADWLTKKEPPK